MARIRKGDRVVVISGKDKGVSGRVIAVYPDTDRVLVEGVNRIRKHTKVTQTSTGAKAGGIITEEAPIHISNVMVAVEADVNGKKRTVGTRVGYQVGEDGSKTRVAKRTGETLQ